MDADLIILGGGPAGLTAGMYASRGSVSVLLLERGFPGGQMAATETVDNYPGFIDPVFGADLAQKMETQARKFGLQIAQTDVKSVAAVDHGFAFKPRSWCAFCPVGTMAKWAGTSRNLLRITEDCTACKVCEPVCPLGIAPHSFKNSGIVADWDCLKCGLCVVRCPQRCLGIGEGKLPRAA